MTMLSTEIIEERTKTEAETEKQKETRELNKRNWCVICNLNIKNGLSSFIHDFSPSRHELVIMPFCPDCLKNGNHEIMWNIIRDLEKKAVIVKNVHCRNFLNDLEETGYLANTQSIDRVYAKKCVLCNELLNYSEELSLFTFKHKQRRIIIRYCEPCGLEGKRQILENIITDLWDKGIILGVRGSK